MCDPIPFPQPRRAAAPSGAEQPADVSSPQHVVPAVHPSNVVSLVDRRPPTSPIVPIHPFYPWGI